MRQDTETDGNEDELVSLFFIPSLRMCDCAQKAHFYIPYIPIYVNVRFRKEFSLFLSIKAIVNYQKLFVSLENSQARYMSIYFSAKTKKRTCVLGIHLLFYALLVLLFQSLRSIIITQTYVDCEIKRYKKWLKLRDTRTAHSMDEP